MDPVTLIVSALLAGAASAAQDTASNVVKDAYSGLKTLLQRRFQGKPAAETALAEAETDPDTWEKPLTKAVAEHGSDEEVLALAQQLRQLLESQQSASSPQLTQINGPQISFPDAVSYLATLYDMGVLVPFIGSGMSMLTCTDWQTFLKKLAGGAGIKAPKSMKSEESKMFLADATVDALRPLTYKERIQRYRDALSNSQLDEDMKITPQSEALAKLDWPLVLSTNYDDIYWRAVGERAPGELDEAQRKYLPWVLGRSIEDCHHVLRSLDGLSPPILWVLQGFVGSKYSSNIIGEAKCHQLADQLVVGHQQYQRATNGDGQFRRAFAEVFRRRSLLFIGSGLLENYLVNLFSEIIHYYGRGPYTHFALLPYSKKQKFNEYFLQVRLGIVPIFYKDGKGGEDHSQVPKYKDGKDGEDHSQVPKYLKKLYTIVEAVRDKTPRQKSYPLQGATTLATRFDEMGYVLFSGKSKAIKVSLLNASLPALDIDCGKRGECFLISAGRGLDNRPKVPDKYDKYLKDKPWNNLDEKPSFAYRCSGAPIFAVAARSRKKIIKQHYDRDLKIIPEAICSVLKKIENAKNCEDAKNFKVVNIGPIASNMDHIWHHPIHSFTQTLRGIRDFISHNDVSNIKRLNIYIENQMVWDCIASAKIPVRELLSSDLTTYRVDLRSSGISGESQSFVVMFKKPSTLEDLRVALRVNRKSWNVEVDQLRRVEPEDSEEPEVSEKPEVSSVGLDTVDKGTIVVPTMRIFLRPRTRGR